MKIPNWPLLTTAIEHIIDNPRDYEQGAWRCGTARCVAGWIAELSGGEWEGTLIAAIWPKGADKTDDSQLVEVDRCAIEALGVYYDYSSDGDGTCDRLYSLLFHGSLQWCEVLAGVKTLAAEDGVELSPKIQAEIAAQQEQGYDL